MQKLYQKDYNLENICTGQGKKDSVSGLIFFKKDMVVRKPNLSKVFSSWYICIPCQTNGFYSAGRKHNIKTSYKAKLK